MAAGLLTLAMTFSRYVPETLPGAAPEDPPASSQSTPAEAEGGYNLHITSASSDGKSLCLTWEIEYPEEAKKYERIVSYGTMDGESWSTSGGFPGEDGFSVLLDGTEPLVPDPFASTDTQGTETGKLVFKRSYALLKKAKVGEKLNFTLTLENLYGILEENGVSPAMANKAEKIPVDFQKEFTVQVGRAMGAYKLDGIYHDEMEKYYVTEAGELKILGHTDGWKSTVQIFTNVESPDFELRFYRDGEFIDSIQVKKQEEDRHERKYENGSIDAFYSHDYGGSFFYMGSPLYRAPDPTEKELAYKWFIMAFVSGTDRVPGRDEGLEMPFPDRIEIVELDGEEETIVSVIEEDQMFDSIGHY